MYEDLELVPLFERLKASELKYIQQYVTLQRFKFRDQIIRHGSGNQYFYIIKSGRVRICCPVDDGGELTIKILRDGDFFGEMSLLEREACSATAICMEACEIYTIRQDKFRKILREIPVLSSRMLKHMSQRIRYSNSCIQNLNCRNSVRRISRVLNQLALESGYRSKRSVIITRIPYQQDVGAMSGTARETVSRTYAYLEAMNYITKNRHQLVIKDYQRFYEDLCL
jgi:CRP/FNR family transcriptional regulator, cyclic AMP receptor protein